jgi:hypothetical protein
VQLSNVVKLCVVAVHLKRLLALMCLQRQIST